ncbi:unnamed protein product [Candidula unifasciata]|uniref:Uncharacterized protein n=1 Tax=Candidula unifasciata TaxID=100452 RepID=A0A8S4A3V9_9EUPU|nr:unnamed protein product [Candidula unifasciata]
MSSESTNSAGLVSFRVGQILLISGSILFIISLATAYWVVRPVVDFQKESIYPNQTLVIRHYGIFIACIQTEDNSDSSGRCESLWENLNFITVLVLQGMIIFAGEIKSKAEKVSGQEDEQPGWSFVLAIVGLFLCIVGVLMSIMFRELPLPGLDKTGGSWLRPHSTPRNKNSQDR